MLLIVFLLLLPLPFPLSLLPQPFNNTHFPVTSCVPSQLLLPLQGPPAPTTQIPISLTPFLLLVLSVPDVESEDNGCAFANVADITDESRLSPITENKNIDMALLLLPLYTDRDARFPTIFCYMRFEDNKQFKRFIVKFCTIFCYNVSYRR
jgi:hypothetical protein